MTTTLPFAELSSELLPGEKIEWTGRPNFSVIFHREDWELVPFSLVWGGFAVFWSLAAFAAFQPFGWILTALLVHCGKLWDLGTFSEKALGEAPDVVRADGSPRAHHATGDYRVLVYER